MRIKVSPLAARHLRRRGSSVYVWVDELAECATEPPAGREFYRERAGEFDVWLEQGFRRPEQLHIGMWFLPPRLVATSTWYDGDMQPWGRDDAGAEDVDSR